MLSSMKPTEVSAETISLLKSLPTAFITDQLYKKLGLRFRAIGFALCFGTESSGKTLPIGLVEFSTEFNMDWGAVMAALMALTIPIALLFLVFHKLFVGCLTAGAIKG